MQLRCNINETEMQPRCNFNTKVKSTDQKTINRSILFRCNWDAIYVDATKMELRFNLDET